MWQRYKVILIGGIVALGLGGVFHSALAATFQLAPDAGVFKIGETFTVDLKIDTVSQSINAAQATILFPKDRLEVVSTERDKSIFDFWLEEPIVLTGGGKLRFVAGAQGGASGGALQILKIVFKTKAEGPAIVSFEDAAITSSDGSGTNLLTALNGAQYTIVPAQFTPPATTTPPVAASTTPLVPPPQIKRTPVPGKGLPAKPNLTIELYPDETQWYNVSAPFLVKWDLPADIAAGTSAINREVNFIPAPVSEGLTEGKLVNALSDGISYFHARFRNDIGWGTTAHRKISIDTAPPNSFSIEVLTGVLGDNPKPELRFATTDALSGIERYVIRVDGGEALETTEGTYTLPKQKPGKHEVSVRAEDRAGNSREARAEVNVLPIPSPTVTFVTSFLTAGSEDEFVAKGVGTKGDTIHVALFNRQDQAVAEGSTTVLESGEWILGLSKSLRVGEYSVKVWAEDARGAESLPLAAGGVLVKAKPALKIGAFEMSAGQVLFAVLVLAIAAGISLWYWLKLKEARRLLRYGLVEYDFGKMMELLERNISDIEKKIGETGAHTEEDMRHYTAALLETVAKMKNYLPKEIGKMKE